MSEEEYEYKVQHKLVDSQFTGWSDSGLGNWLDEATAVERFKRYVASEDEAERVDGVRDFRYRIIRRPKNSETVYLTEEDTI